MPIAARKQNDWRSKMSSSAFKFVRSKWERRSAVSCRVPREIPYMLIVCGRVKDPTACPGEGALIKKCSICEENVWIAPRTVRETGLRPPLVCKQCFGMMREILEEK